MSPDNRGAEPKRAQHRQPLTVAQLIAHLVNCNDASAIPEFTFDGETYFHVHSVTAGDAITLDVEVATYG